MRLRIELAVTVPKDIRHQELNEDAWAVDETLTKVALSDGASESFDSRTWARLIVGTYANDSAFSAEWLGSVLANYLATIDYEALSWSKQAAFDRGSFATLLGLELAPNGANVEILALGDTVAFHLRDSKLVASFPYTDAAEFDKRPQLLSTVAASNDFIRESGFFGRNTSRSWSVKAGDVLLLATDAVAQWALLEQGPDLDALIFLQSVASDEEFESTILKLRQERRIRLDDSTLIRIVVEG